MGDHRSDKLLIHDIIVDSKTDRGGMVACAYGTMRDQAPSGSICTLRTAIELINADQTPGTWVIQLPAGNIELTRPLPPIVTHIEAFICGHNPQNQGGLTPCDPDFKGQQFRLSAVVNGEQKAEKFSGEAYPASATVSSFISGESPHPHSCQFRAL